MNGENQNNEINKNGVITAIVNDIKKSCRPFAIGPIDSQKFNFFPNTNFCNRNNPKFVNLDK